MSQFLDCREPNSSLTFFAITSTVTRIPQSLPFPSPSPLQHHSPDVPRHKRGWQQHRRRAVPQPVHHIRHPVTNKAACLHSRISLPDHQSEQGSSFILTTNTTLTTLATSQLWSPPELILHQRSAPNMQMQRCFQRLSWPSNKLLLGRCVLEQRMPRQQLR